ncbi:hypothetical protein [Caulobacter sp. 17J80-11]|uniref:hypothetical protein n=1 Tax=Caulobacter sp. 17J80-11 TaxID=2763502 RepID=UPI0016534F42|nr:hypothetical protein [Caulobacter sp. 17J80-11]MBC6981123.1 hypothetical protein [Caulobacter sp. 17J80-11]
MIALAALLALAAQPAGGWTWSLYDNPNQVALALEIPDTDRLEAVFQCAPRSGEVKLTLYKLTGEGGTAELSSEAATTTAPLADRKDLLVVTLPVGDPVFLSLVRSGKLAVKSASGTAAVTPPTDKLQQLARRCGS